SHQITAPVKGVRSEFAEFRLRRTCRRYRAANPTNPKTASNAAEGSGMGDTSTHVAPMRNSSKETVEPTGPAFPIASDSNGNGLAVVKLTLLPPVGATPFPRLDMAGSTNRVIVEAPAVVRDR